VVAASPTPRRGDRQRVLGHELDQLIVQAKKAGIGLTELQQAMDVRWKAQDAAGREEDE
jgi:hypothetical protein